MQEHACTCARTNVCVRAKYTCAPMHAHTHQCMHACTRARTHILMYMHACMYLHVRVEGCGAESLTGWQVERLQARVEELEASLQQAQPALSSMTQQNHVRATCICGVDPSSLKHIHVSIYSSVLLSGSSVHPLVPLVPIVPSVNLSICPPLPCPSRTFIDRFIRPSVRPPLRPFSRDLSSIAEHNHVCACANSGER